MANMTPKDFQQSLTNAGFDCVWIDGQWGGKTADACALWFTDGKAIEIVDAGATPPPDVVRQVVPTAWMPVCRMDRVIVHWTAGAYEASENDKDHYHVLVEADLNLVRGTHSIDDNVNTKDGDYAAHTLNCNTNSIGISACCMANAVESPFNAGKWPLQQEQWIMLARVAADLCREYGIKVTPKTVLQHGEVQANLGIVQRGKWDICKLPWEPKWSHSKVGEDFREKVQDFL